MSNQFSHTVKKSLAVLLLFISSALHIHAQARKSGDTILLADPTIFAEKGVYYLYGTGSKDGFWVYRSTDLKNWAGPVGKRGGHALLKGDSYGTKGFWAPQIFKYNNKYIIAYTADEHIAIAESNSPLGPFIQKNKVAVSGPGKQIDPFVFKDTDGKLYLFHVRLQNGNRIFVVRINPKTWDIDESTAKECLHAELHWENTENAPWPVSEGPTVMKRGNLYYMFYSANDFHNIDYAVGYATSTSPFGPWKKADDSPIISRKNTGANGTGHGDFFKDTKGNLYYVLHTHNTNSKVDPRKSAIVSVKFADGKPVADSTGFRFLQLK
ncbi:MAG: glycoside hydrolase family 43 protein [Mucilaginibacter sp.]|nr:glycoside hydrolase family 43 protein [Mucilaginibacter sp.]